jgi:ParB-like chromosome segregation protein Spo0J
MGISDLVKDIKWLVEQLADYPEKERINALNEIRASLHEVSPFKNEPIDLVLWVPAGEVQANDYNPNTVAPPEMRLLETSILADGYTQPIVAFPEPGEDREYTVIDGFHRNRVGKESEAVRARVKGYLPLTLAGDANTPKENRMASTIRHNRARGKHGVTAMSEIVVELARRNWSDEKIAKELGMDADEVLRLKQITGLAEMFADREFSMAWEAE